MKSFGSISPRKMFLSTPANCEQDLTILKTRAGIRLCMWKKSSKSWENPQMSRNLIFYMLCEKVRSERLMLLKVLVEWLGLPSFCCCSKASKGTTSTTATATVTPTPTTTTTTTTPTTTPTTPTTTATATAPRAACKYNCCKYYKNYRDKLELHGIITAATRTSIRWSEGRTSKSLPQIFSWPNREYFACTVLFWFLDMGSCLFGKYVTGDRFKE